MSQPKKRPTASQPGGETGPPASEDGNDALESLPEILEVFGAAPLVNDFDFAPADTFADAHDEAARTDDASADDEDVPDEPARDASGRFVSPQAEARDEEPARDHGTSPVDDERTRPGKPSGPAITLGGAAREIPLHRERDVVGGTTRPASPEQVRVVVGDEISARLENSLTAGLHRMRELVGLSEERLGRLEATLDDLSKQTSFLPGKLRGLGGKLDGLTSALGDERCKRLLESLVAVLDLVDGALAAFPADDESAREPRRYFETIGMRMRQILEDNHLHPIPTDVPFDPALHHALQQVPVEDVEHHGAIVEVFRRGWRGQTGVLRFADVAVGRQAPHDAPAPQVAPPGQPKEGGQGGPAEPSGGADAIPVHELDPSELDELVAPPGPPPRTVTDSSSITFRSVPPRNDRAR